MGRVEGRTSRHDGSWSCASAIAARSPSTSDGGPPTGLRALEQLYEQPIVSSKDVQKLLGTTFAGANQIVRRLVDLGIIREITGHARNRRFRYDAYVSLFEEGPKHDRRLPTSEGG